tara:strand:- start:37 stop:162 length:126 start_codon:yes stop_codon:yes gene_type:complete
MNDINLKLDNFYAEGLIIAKVKLLFTTNHSQQLGTGFNSRE